MIIAFGALLQSMADGQITFVKRKKLEHRVKIIPQFFPLSACLRHVG
jgi:hypothetical protein